MPVSSIVLDKEPGQRWVAVSPFSAHEGKCYPLELMKQVVARLSQRGNYWIFLMGGGKEEKKALRSIARENQHVISMAELKHGFTDEYALLGKCDVMLTMDSANMHLASLMGLKTVTIWGATAPSCGFHGLQALLDLWRARVPLWRFQVLVRYLARTGRRARCSDCRGPWFHPQESMNSIFIKK